MAQNPTAASLVRRVAYKTWAQGRLARQRGDVETNNTTARTQQGTAETTITTAPKNCTKKAHFAPAKAMAVSIPHGYKRAKAMAVSGNRAHRHAGRRRGRRAWLRCPWAAAGPGRTTRRRTKPHVSTPGPTGVKAAGGAAGPGCGARGRWRGLAGQRVDAPSGARCADGSRAGRRPRAHQAARPHTPTGGAPSGTPPVINTR